MQRGMGFGAAVLAAVCSVAAQAESVTSSATSSAASSASSASGSVSDSVGMSSDSSKDRKPAVVAGRYQVEAVEPWAAGRVRVRLQGSPELPPLDLRLPAGAVDAGQLRVGAWVEVQDRSYGWALSRVGEEAFFLLLNDLRDLQTRAL